MKISSFCSVSSCFIWSHSTFVFFTLLNWTSSAAKVKSFNLPFWSLCLKWIKESNKISFQTFNFPGLQALSLTQKWRWLWAICYFLWNISLGCHCRLFYFFFFFYIGEKEILKEKDLPCPPKKRHLLATHTHSFAYWSSSFLGRPCQQEAPSSWQQPFLIKPPI